MNLSRLHSTLITFKNHMNDTFYAYTKILLKKPPGGVLKILTSRNRQESYKPFNKAKSMLHWVKITSQAAIYTFCVMSTFASYVGYPAQVYGMSMQPEFNELQVKSKLYNYSSNSVLRLDLDAVWVSCWNARNFEFQRGDIVVFVSPKDPYEYVIKRIIALEGDMVETNKGDLIRVKIPKGHCWVEGDNWNNSVDSNKYGPIPLGLIFGVATNVIWPVHKQRRLNRSVPDYLLPERVQSCGEATKGVVLGEGEDTIAKPKTLWQQLKILLYFMHPSEKDETQITKIE